MIDIYSLWLVFMHTLCIPLHQCIVYMVSILSSDVDNYDLVSLK